MAANQVLISFIVGRRAACIFILESRQFTVVCSSDLHADWQLREYRTCGKKCCVAPTRMETNLPQTGINLATPLGIVLGKSLKKNYL